MPLPLSLAVEPAATLKLFLPAALSHLAAPALPQGCPVLRSYLLPPLQTYSDLTLIPPNPMPLDNEDHSFADRLDPLIYLYKCDHSQNEARQAHQPYRHHPVKHHNAEGLLRSVLRP